MNKNDKENMIREFKKKIYRYSTSMGNLDSAAKEIEHSSIPEYQKNKLKTLISEMQDFLLNERFKEFRGGTDSKEDAWKFRNRDDEDQPPEAVGF